MGVFMFIYHTRKKVALFLFIAAPLISFFAIEAIPLNDLFGMKGKGNKKRSKQTNPQRKQKDQQKSQENEPREPLEKRAREALSYEFLRQVGEHLGKPDQTLINIHNTLNETCRDAQRYHNPADIKSCKNAWYILESYAKELEQQDQYELLQKIWILKHMHPWMYDYSRRASDNNHDSTNQNSSC